MKRNFVEFIEVVDSHNSRYLSLDVNKVVGVKEGNRVETTILETKEKEYVVEGNYKKVLEKIKEN